MSSETEKSFVYCRELARRRARNFYYAFRLLPKPQREAICAIYAFMRQCDDLSDEPGATHQAARAGIGRWRGELDRALDGQPGEHPLWPAFQETVRRYKIPHEYFYEMIEGVGSDLEPRQIRTFDELYRYCYQVASVAGLAAIHIFGFRSPEALPLAEKCGVAFQLTNILRDVREDAERERVYLPAEDLQRFGVDAGDFATGRSMPAFVELMRFEAGRARSYYAESAPLVGLIDASSRSSLWALIEIYRRLLERIEKSNFDVLERRIALPAAEKIGIMLRAALRRG